MLESKGTALGAVSAIAGQTRLWVVVNGTQVKMMESLVMC